jgi:hypothetical protein
MGALYENLKDKSIKTDYSDEGGKSSHSAADEREF